MTSNSFVRLTMERVIDGQVRAATVSTSELREMDLLIGYILHEEAVPVAIELLIGILHDRMQSCKSLDDINKHKGLVESVFDVVAELDPALLEEHQTILEIRSRIESILFSKHTQEDSEENE
jgi:hypothetical protein